MPVYLHEIIHTVPGQEERYMTSIQGFGDGGYWLHPESTPPPPVSTRIGPFRTTEVSGVWPKTINLGGGHEWERMVGAFAMQFTATEDPKAAAHLEDWWQRNVKLRTRGDDRVLVPAPGAPTADDVREQGLKARVFLQLIERVRWGEAERYLARMLDSFRPAAMTQHWSLFGAYRVAFHPNEVLSVWGAERWQDFGALLGGRGGPQALEFWRTYRDEVVTKCDEMVLIPGRTNLNQLPRE